MAYKVMKVEIEKAYEMIKDYSYSLVYMISDIYLCKTEQLPAIDWEECLEARFFSKEGELHIYEEDGEYKAVQVVEEGQEHSIVKKYKLGNKFKNVGTHLYVQQYLNYDTDGQAVIALTRLKDIE